MQSANLEDTSNLKNELKAFSESAALSALNTQLISLTGSDRLEFLHGQITNQVKQLVVGGVNQALLLNHKGHALAQMSVLRRDEDLLVFVEDNAAGLVQNQLDRHIIFDQVTLTDSSSDFASFSLQGPEATKLLESLFTLPDKGQFNELSFEGAPLIIYTSTRSSNAGFDLHVASENARALSDALQAKGAVQVSAKAAELSRIEAAIPKVVSEAGEGVLPQEAALEFAISYTKGCYLGQEIMARIEARGKLKRGLQKVKLESLPSEGGRDIFLGTKKVGRLGQVSEHPTEGLIGLAVMRTDIDASQRLTVSDSQVVIL